jgi:hypothetical protein
MRLHYQPALSRLSRQELPQGALHVLGYRANGDNAGNFVSGPPIAMSLRRYGSVTRRRRDFCGAGPMSDHAIGKEPKP